MSSVPDLSRLTPAGEHSEDSPADTAAVAADIRVARDYLSSFRWCGGIAASFIGLAVPGKLLVALHQILPLEEGIDEWLWTVTGDLPPAYLVVDEAPTPGAALDAYLFEMQQWIEAVRMGQPTAQLIPVDVEPTPQHADMLEARLRIIERANLADTEDE